MLNCLYMAIWTTNLLTITKDVLHYAHYEVITQLAMCIPIVVVFVFLPYITETCALLGAVAEIHVGVCKKVLEVITTAAKQTCTWMVLHQMVTSITCDRFDVCCVVLVFVSMIALF